MALRLLTTLVLLASACASQLPKRGETPTNPAQPLVERSENQAQPTSVPAHQPCQERGELIVTFYDVAQGLAALVTLPDGRHVLVDTGDAPDRSGCGGTCEQAHAHLLSALGRDLHGAAIDLLWITHQHSDHIGGAPDVLARFDVRNYVDNGRDLTSGPVAKTRSAAQARDTPITVVDPNSRNVPLSSVVSLRAVVPSAWPADCAQNPNECSIGLRIDYCSSSLLFTRDMELGEERALHELKPVTLLQLGHQGSDTSSSDALLDAAKPEYAVISAGHPDEGLNKTYCHPRQTTIERLRARLGGPVAKTIRSFDGTVSCRTATPEHWHDVPASDRIWATERDGDVTLVTAGDGRFAFRSSQER